MQNKIKLINSALFLIYFTTSSHTQAALPSKAILNFESGIISCQAGGTFPTCQYGATTVQTGSYFSMDLTDIGTFNETERTPILSASNGLTLTGAQTAGAIDLDWTFASVFGRHLTNNALAETLTGTNTYNINMAGWIVNWGAEGDIDMGAGTATLTCNTDCTLGDTFVLSYDTTVPSGSFTGTNYELHLEGTISSSNTPPISGNVTIASVPANSHTWIPQVSDTDTLDTLTCTIASQGINRSTASVQSDCSSGTYQPNGGASFTGTDSFTYKVNDGTVDSSPVGTVSVTIGGNPPPVCQNISGIFGSSLFSGATTTLIIDVTDAATCSDASGNSTIVANTLSVSSPSTNNATVSVDASTGIVTYISAFGFSGTDTFTYTVDDNNGTSEAATVTILIAANSTSSPTTSNGALACGTTADSVGNSSCIVTMNEIGINDVGFGREQGLAQTCIGGCFDFTVNGLTTGGDAVVVLALSTAIPAAAAANTGNKIIYRKLMPTGWQDFDTSSNNAIASAAGTSINSDFICPAANDSSYINGTTPGDRCIQLTITDGGPNDADGLANGTVVDPGGLSETFFTSGSDGCSISTQPVEARERADWWIVAGFLCLLGFITFTRNKKSS